MVIYELSLYIMDNQDTTTKNNKRYDAIGVVEECLPDTHFRARREDTNELLMCYLSGKMKKHRIRIVMGDKVGILINEYGGKSRITQRL